MYLPLFSSQNVTYYNIYVTNESKSHSSFITLVIALIKTETAQNQFLIECHASSQLK